jgi:hypothetical protein
MAISRIYCPRNLFIIMCCSKSCCETFRDCQIFYENWLLRVVIRWESCSVCLLINRRYFICYLVCSKDNRRLSIRIREEEYEIKFSINIVSTWWAIRFISVRGKLVALYHWISKLFPSCLCLNNYSLRLSA